MTEGVGAVVEVEVDEEEVVCFVDVVVPVVAVPEAAALPEAAASELPSNVPTPDNQTE